MSELAQLEREFDDEMRGIYTRALRECKYNAHLYLAMLNEHRGVETARRLLSTRDDVQYGFTELYLKRRLDLTVEYLVLHAKRQPLITEDQRRVAKQRLLAHDFPESDLPA